MGNTSAKLRANCDNSPGRSTLSIDGGDGGGSESPPGSPGLAPGAGGGWAPAPLILSARLRPLPVERLPLRRWRRTGSKRGRGRDWQRRLRASPSQLPPRSCWGTTTAEPRPSFEYALPGSEGGGADGLGANHSRVKGEAGASKDRGGGRNWHVEFFSDERDSRHSLLGQFSPAFP